MYRESLAQNFRQAKKSSHLWPTENTTRLSCRPIGRFSYNIVRHKIRPLKSFGGEAKAGGQKGRGLGGIPLFLCSIKMRPVPPPCFSKQDTTEKYSFH